jgi:hypothetical protein
LEDDFDLIIHRVTNTPSIFKLKLIADLHRGSPQFNQVLWDREKQEILSDPAMYVGWLGDLMNNGIKTSKTNCYEETERPSAQKAWLRKEMEDLASKSLFIVPGNHEYRNLKEVDNEPLWDICQALHMEDLYRPNIAFLKLYLGKQQIPYMGAATHHGGTIYQNERFSGIIDGLDFYVSAHTHHGITSKPQKIVIDPYNNKVSFRDYACVTTTSFLNYGGYPIRKILPAQSTVTPTLLFDTTHKTPPKILW